MLCKNLPMGAMGVLIAGVTGVLAGSLSAQEQANPFTAVPDVRAGQQLFPRHCSICHGEGAAGGDTAPDLTTGELEGASAGAGVLHGGAMATLLDTCCTHAGIFCTVPENYRSGATVTLTVNFIGPVRLGQRITAIARKTGGGGTVFMSAGEARDESGKIVATAQAVGRYRDGSGKPEGMPRPAGTAPGRSPGRFEEG